MTSVIESRATHPAIIFDSYEISNSIDKNREGNKRGKGSNVILPLLFDPEFVGMETNQITGDKYPKYVLKTLDAANIAYDIQPLDFRDYIIPSIDDDGDPVVEVIERKTVTDLIGSFTSTASVKNAGKKGKIRVDIQVDKCVKRANEYFDNARVSLLIEDYYNCRFDFTENGLGVWIQKSESFSKNKTDREGRPIFNFVGYSKRLINPASLLGKIREIEHKGVNIIYCGGANHAYRKIMDMVNRATASNRVPVQAIRRKPSRMDPDDEILFHLQGSPGVAGGMSYRLLDKYPVLIDLYTAIARANDADDLGIKGFKAGKFEPFKGMLTRKFGKLKKEEEKEE